MAVASLAGPTGDVGRLGEGLPLMARRGTRCKSRARRPAGREAGTRPASRWQRMRDERGEVFPSVILFFGVMLTVLIGVHVILVALGRTAVQSAADRGVLAVQTAPLGDSNCGDIGGSLYGEVRPTTQRECEGILAAATALSATASMVRVGRLPFVDVNDEAGIVSVVTFGSVVMPILGVVEIIGRSCGPLEFVEDGTPTRADITAC